MLSKSLRFNLLGVCILMTASLFDLNAATPASGREFGDRE
jgi:hypothetical protein